MTTEARARLDNIRLAAMRFTAKLKIEHIFVILASSVGILFVFLTPSIAVVDEENHFFRAYELSQGNVYTDPLNDQRLYGANIPENMAFYVYYNKGVAIGVGAPSKDIIDRVASETPDAVKTREVVYNASAAYSPAGYIPQAVGMFIAKVFNTNNETYLYLGRLLNLIVFIIVVYFAIRFIPVGKTVLFVAALLPTTIYQAASLSMDAILIASTFLAISMSILILFSDKFPRKNVFIALSLAIIFIALTKYVYLVMIAPILIFWIFASEKANKLKSMVIIVGILLLSLSLLFLWNSNLSSDVTAPAGALEANTKVISVGGQIKHIMQDPLSYLSSIIDLFFFDTVSADVLLRGMIGRYGWMGGNYFAPLVSMMLGFAAIIFASLIDKAQIPSRTLRVIRKRTFVYFSLFIMSSIIAIVGVVTGLYVAFTSVGDSKILGVQGRYFIPVIPVLMMAFIMLRSSVIKLVDVQKAKTILYLMVLGNLFYAVATITGAYY